MAPEGTISSSSQCQVYAVQTYGGLEEFMLVCVCETELEGGGDLCVCVCVLRDA